MKKEKYIKVKFAERELSDLRRNAALYNKSVNQYIHDCAMGVELEVSPLYVAFTVAEQLAGIREELNAIFRRETEADVRLFEDDVIQLDRRMNAVEVAMADYLKSTTKEVG